MITTILILTILILAITFVALIKNDIKNLIVSLIEKIERIKQDRFSSKLNKLYPEPKKIKLNLNRIILNDFLSV